MVIYYLPVYLYKKINVVVNVIAQFYLRMRELARAGANERLLVLFMRIPDDQLCNFELGELAEVRSWRVNIVTVEADRVTTTIPAGSS